MKYLNPFSFFTALVLLASCHSSDVVLRHSKTNSCLSEDIHVQTAQNENIKASTKDTLIFNTEAPSLVASVKAVSTAYTKTLQSFSKTATSAKQQTNQAKHPAKQYATAGTTANHKIPKLGGFVGNVGFSFGVVGLVFIIVGLVLFIVGGLIIDTLAAVAIGFGFVFILIWLVLAIVQKLFDVIL